MKDKVDLDIMPKTNEDFTTETFQCDRFIDSYRSLSRRLDSLIEAFGTKKHKSLKNLKKQIVGDNNSRNIVTEIETLISKDRTNDSLKKHFSASTSKVTRSSKFLNNWNCVKNWKRNFLIKGTFKIKK